MHTRPYQHTAFPAFITATAVLAIWLPLPSWAGGVIAAAWLASLGLMLGRALLPREHAGWSWFLGTLVSLSGTMVIGSAVYYLANLGRVAVAATLVLATIVAIRWTSELKERESPFGGLLARFMDRFTVDRAAPSRPAVRLLRIAVGIGAIVATAWCLWQAVGLVSGAATTDSIRSPWDVVPPQAFGYFAVAVALTFTAAHGALAPRLSVAATALLLAFIASVAAMAYRIGFGFDPFLHRATEETIFAAGFIEPKPFYYVGQYAIVTIVARFLDGGVAGIDRALVPIALGLLAPTAYFTLRRGYGLFRPSAAAATVGLLFLPLAAFAATTPQGLANVLFLITCCLALAASLDRFPLPPVGVIAAATTAVHPLAGVPLVAFVMTLAAVKAPESPAMPRVLRHPAAPWVLAIAGSLALPAMFMLNSLLSGATAAVDTEALRSGATALFAGDLPPTRRYDLSLDFTYAWNLVRAVAWFAFGAAGLMLIRRRTGAWLAWAIGAAMLAANWFIMKAAVRLPFLISYEQSSYADRVADLLIYLIVPLALVAAGAALDRMRTAGSPLLRVVATALVAATAASSLYLAYPRRDGYSNSRGWSVGAADIAAVREIDADAAGRPYVVLANQAVSAAAVQELGFRTYYDSRDGAHPGPVFFYPIPTGGPLYDLFLRINLALGDEEIARQAMDLAGVDLAYYVVNHYWWDAHRITIGAKKDADRSWVAGAKDHVFRYSR